MNSRSKPPRAPRNRLVIAAWLVLVIVAGLGSRRLSGPAVVTLYFGDLAWGALFFGIFCMLWPGETTLRLWLLAVLTTELIEFSQLYHSPWLDAFRETRLGGLLLGHAFLWSDVACVAIGASFAALLTWMREQRARASRRPGSADRAQRSV